MRLYRSVFTLFTLLALSASCSKDDHPIPKSCRYIGQNYTMEQISAYHEWRETYVSNFKQDDEGKLIEASGTRKTHSASPSNDEVRSEVIETQSYLLKYNEQGFLTEITYVKLTLQEGGQFATFGYENYPNYHHGRIEQKEVTTFKYESDLLRSSTRTSVVDFKSEKTQDVKVTADSKKEYIYETNGVIKTITETVGNYTDVTQYKNGVRASTPTNKYDEKGQLVQSLSPDAEYNLKYDNNGNILSVEAIYKSEQQFLETRTHDNHPNPDKLLPSKFKGIPETMRLLQYTDGNNNLTGSKSVYPDRPTYEEKTIFTYNAAGFPATAVSTYTQGDDSTTKTTTYNYQDCQ
jgi:YD repeat-containing protein